MSKFKKVSKTLGGFFNTKEHTKALAVLFEPKRSRFTENNFTKQQDRLTIDGDITIFNSKEQLSGEEPPVVMENAAVNDTLVARDLEDALGEMVLATCATAPNKKGPHPLAVIRDVTDPATIEAVEAYLEKRDAEIAAQLEDIPDFMK